MADTTTPGAAAPTTDYIPSDPQREAFEDWSRSSGYKAPLLYLRQADAPDEYVYPEIALMWDCWRAAQSASVQQLTVLNTMRKLTAERDSLVDAALQAAQRDDMNDSEGARP